MTRGNDTWQGIGEPKDDDALAPTMNPFRVGGEYVGKAQFWRLLSNLRLYAIWYEVFLLIDGGTKGRTVEDDHRLSRTEWHAALEGVKAAGATWAPYKAFAHASKVRMEPNPWDPTLPAHRTPPDRPMMTCHAMTWHAMTWHAMTWQADFEIMDRDKGGWITLDEFVTFVRASEEVSRRARGPPASPLGSQPHPALW